MITIKYLCLAGVLVGFLIWTYGFLIGNNRRCSIGVRVEWVFFLLLILIYWIGG